MGLGALPSDIPPTLALPAVHFLAAQVLVDRLPVCVLALGPVLRNRALHLGSQSGSGRVVPQRGVPGQFVGAVGHPKLDPLKSLGDFLAVLAAQVIDTLFVGHVRQTGLLRFRRALLRVRINLRLRRGPVADFV